MNHQYWDGLAGQYEAEVFDVLAHDKRGLIAERIERCGAKGGVAIDLGCGIGRFLPFLSRSFGRVLAVDFSEACLQRARMAAAGLDGIEFRRQDASSPCRRLPKADLILSVNAVITPSLTVRMGIFQTIKRSLVVGGRLLLVVPSLESALYASSRLIEWNLRDGMRACNAVRSGFGSSGREGPNRVAQGVVLAGGVPTKHYLREELVALLSAHCLGVCEVEKLEYPWRTEFASPPSWMGEPYPWDWLVLAQRRK